MAKTPAQRAAKHGTPATPAAQGPGAGSRAGGGAKGASANSPSANSAGANSAGAKTDPARAQGNPNLIVIAGVVASAFLFWYLHLLTLNQMTQLAGGRAMPDSLPGGFDPGYVDQLRAAMNPAALGQLQFVHKTAGTLFPLVFALTSAILIGLNVANKALRRALWIPPLLFVIAELWANFAIDGVLSGPAPDPARVALASILVTASWVLLTISVLASAWALYRGQRGRQKLRTGTTSTAQQRPS
ncbi:hypothetical protein IV498_05300 [Paenarthrobacter sp. Z7-10]|uniref:hypothetical protein n=1 Tax=Paenarthrobacter sp. Z7-10 TaxID=2787635 RepID=UPI0022A93EE7|nr:hypothetical protein [Paenarthrobacter sp. Z7-10]MCZ2402613.1 hypothetical protein [Paenarthrobacter sp. Z7-10]